MAEHDLRAVAFPKLDDVHMAALGHCIHASLKPFRAGQKLFEMGDPAGRFFVIKSGQVEIVNDSGDKPRTITVVGPGEFTGEVGQLTGGPMLVTAVARTDCEVFEISADGLREI